MSFNDESFSKLMDTPGVNFSSLKHFMRDKRLTEPISIMGFNDDLLKVDGKYVTELSHVFFNNGY